MSKRRGERRIFELFLHLEPDFLGEAVTRWRQPRRDPPDVLCVTRSGKRVGVELVSWIDRSMFERSVQQETADKSFISALSRRANRTRNIGLVFMVRRADVPGRLPPDDRRGFREAMFRLLEDADRRWHSAARSSLSGPWHRLDLEAYPPLGRYLERVEFFPSETMRPWARGVPWITFPVAGVLFEERDMLPSLFANLDLKRSRADYEDLATDDLVLVVHYDRALVHNPPVLTPYFTLEQAAREARRYLGDDPGPFSRIFLLAAILPGAAVVRIHP